MAAGSIKEPNRKAPKPVEEVFELKQLGKGPISESARSLPKARKSKIHHFRPPKAVDIKKTRK